MSSRLVGAALAVAVLLMPACGADKEGSRAGDSGTVEFRDVGVGLSGRHPEGWHRAKAVSEILDPREVLVLATYPLRGGNEAGECAPRRPLADLPPDGAFVWLIEYRPLRGDVWADFPRSRFKVKPDHFRLLRSDLARNIACHPGPGYTTTFRAADRPFQLFVAFGDRVSDERLSEVETTLDSLRFETLPAPSPDPYAGWPLINDSPGDSLRPPPGWPAAAVMFRLESVRPRPLFFASNVPLAGLPTKLVPHVDALPGDWPFATRALDAFPRKGVLLWVVEERAGEASKAFQAIELGWPRRADFEETKVATSIAPEVMWLRAGGSFQGYRFTVWIGGGPDATDNDLRLALHSASSLAVSGCRDREDGCTQ
jgi:hypothetical protein